MQICSGEYEPISGEYSEELRSMLESLLTLDPEGRPDINTILQLPILQNEIKNHLDEELQ
jgi:hypothetical protein